MSNPRPKLKTRKYIAIAWSKIPPKGATIDEIVAKVRKDHREAIKVENDALVDFALRTLANESRNLRPRAAVRGQGDLFLGYAVPEMVTMPSPDKSGKIESRLYRLDTLTVAQVRQYISDHKQVPKLSRRIIETERLLDFVSPYGGEGSTMGECWKTAMAATRKSGSRS